MDQEKVIATEDIELTLPYETIGRLFCKAQAEGKTMDQLVAEALEQELARLEAIHGPLAEASLAYDDLQAEHERLSKDYELLRADNERLKKNNDRLSEENVILARERDKARGATKVMANQIAQLRTRLIVVKDYLRSAERLSREHADMNDALLRDTTQT
jgi:chromosome segregation ATPase